MIRPVHKWFIEPLDAKTNDVLARNQQFLCDEQIFDGALCSDGKPHRLWGCTDYAFVSKFDKSRAQLGISYKIWHQEAQGKIREWNFPEKKATARLSLKKTKP